MPIKETCNKSLFQFKTATPPFGPMDHPTPLRTTDRKDRLLNYIQYRLLRPSPDVQFNRYSIISTNSISGGFFL